MSGKIRRMLPHLVILICNMYIVFFLIDRVNTAMNFIDNNLTKGLLLILCAAGISNALYLMRMERAPRRETAAHRISSPSRRTADSAGRRHDDVRTGRAASGDRYGSPRASREGANRARDTRSIRRY